MANAELITAVDGLPRYYSYKDVLDLLFSGDEDRFFDAWCDGTLPLVVRRTCEDTLDPVRLQTALLRRSIRVQLQLLAVQQALLDEIRQAPTVDRV